MSDVAIVGMACLFPGAPDLATFEANLVAGRDSIREVPAGRWDTTFFDAQSGADDRFYTRRGGFVDELATIDPARLGVMPKSAQSVEPDQLLALDVAMRALADAGLGDKDFDRSRAGVILGRGNYAGAGRTRLEQHVRGAEQLVRALRSLVPGVSEADLARVKRELQAASGWAGADAAIGLVPNLTASRIANRLDLGGAAYTVDAACASSLLAVDQAVGELRSRRHDVVLAGGVHFCHDEAFWSVFCQLGALSRKGDIRPFDRDADGVLLGEGCGIVVLRRREDAERDGERIYAIIRGTAVASDGRGSLMAPSVDGQVRALTRAWKDAGLDPATCGLVEAHGTATPAGDAAEIETMHRVFGATELALGTVKSNIGHAMPAAGVAGLIKAALALHRRELLPTLHCDTPRTDLGRFAPQTALAPWSGAKIRRAAVNAFGFGGIDAHVVLEEADPAPRRRAHAALHLETLGAARLAVIDATPERLATAQKAIARNLPWRGKGGIFYSPAPLLAAGKIAFVYPGIDAAARARVPAEELGWALADEPTSIEHAGASLVEAGRALTAALADAGIAPAMACGHSVGEWSAMAAMGMLEPAQVDTLAASARAGTLEVPGVIFAAVGCGTERAHAALEGLPDIAVTHDNCPHQVILCGVEASVNEAVARLRKKGVLGQVLPFRSGFHSPLFAPYLGVHAENFARLEITPPTIPIWSATTCAPFPSDAGEVRELALRHLVEPVRFRELIDRMYAEGARVFVQVGPGSLVSFIEDTLRGRPHLAIAVTDEDEVARASAAIWAEGGAPRLAAPRVAAAPAPRGTFPLALSVPLHTFERPLAVSVAPARATPATAAFADLLADIGAAAAEVSGMVGKNKKKLRVVRRLSVETHPWLLDHTFMRQPPGWPSVPDRHPVVPMTTTLHMMMTEAAALAPGQVAIEIRDVRALRWLAIPTPTDVHFDLALEGDRVRVVIDGFAEATVVLASAYPPPPPHVPLAGTMPSKVDAEALYRDRWMFHGPTFQGVRTLGPHGESTATGTIEAGAAPGALLDNAGQIYGYWVMERATRDRLAMPVGVERLRLFGPHPAPGAMLDCDVTIRALEARRVLADLTLAHRGKVWCAITGWEDRRFDTDDRLWDVLIWPEHHSLSTNLQDVVLFEDTYRAAPTREQLMRRYLGERERALYESESPRGQRAHLAGRIAAKDAIRRLLGRTMYPVEIELTRDPQGRPIVLVPDRLHVSIAHKDDLAVAMAARHPVGVDLERIELRGEAFVETAFDPSELALVQPGEDLAEWQTRLWAAKEAVGKALGTGLAGAPRRLRVSDRTGTVLLCEGHEIETLRRGEHVIAWTL